MKTFTKDIVLAGIYVLVIIGLSAWIASWGVPL